MSHGYVRVVNQRVDLSPQYQIKQDEEVILVDHTHLLLGNPFIINDQSDVVARNKVIADYKVYIELDISRRGPMYEALKIIAENVKSGAKICLQCHCKPSACHADIIAQKVNQMIVSPTVGGGRRRDKF